MQQQTQLPTNIELNNGYKMPIIGFGTYANNNQYDQLKSSIKYAIKKGYKLIDTAKLYENHKIIGEAFQECFKENLIKREDLFLTTKIINDGTEPAVDVSNFLKDLQLDYIDLLLIHWPVGKFPLHVLWKKLEECVKKGQVRSLGLSNFTVPLILDLLTYAEIKPVVNQIEFSPYCQPMTLAKFCQKNSIAVTSYSSFCKGEAGLKFENFTKDVFQDEILKKITQNYPNKTMGQVILNWILQYNFSVIPKSFSEKRIDENFDIFDFKVNDEDVKTIEKLNENLRVVNPINHWFSNFQPLFD